MIAAPAVDLRGGRCVQLVGGRPEEERVSLPDPAAVARRWWDAGFGTLHVVDLDAALSEGDNRDAVRSVLGASAAEVQVGGGVREEEDVRTLLEAGVRRVVVGTRAVDDPDWLAALAESRPWCVMVAADVRDGMVLRKGWTEASPLRLDEFLDRVGAIPVAGILCTDVAREGRMEGIDRAGAEGILKRSRHPVWMSGGVTTLEDIEALEGAGAQGVVLGMALYTGRLDAGVVAARWGGRDSPAPVKNATASEGCP